MRIPRAVFVIGLLFALAAVISAQRNPVPTPTVPPPLPPPEDVIRISSNLVLVDALVVDEENRQVKDLKAEDFEIFQDGERQEITSFSYVDGAEKKITVQKQSALGKKLSPPPVKLTDESLGRVITFVIDDGNCLATLEGAVLARDGIRKFINEQMRPDDKVAIYRTRGGSSLLQMYTSNKEALLNEVNRVKWVPSRCSSAFEAARDKSTLKIMGGAESFESEEDKANRLMFSGEENQNAVVGSLGVLGFVVDRLRVLPQRKIVFFVSEGILTPFGSRARSALDDLTDKASRASVVIYTVSTKGVSIPGFMSSQDDVSPGIVSGVDETIPLVQSRRDEEKALDEGMAYLSYSTGGKWIRNQNFIDKAVENVLETETGYYLLGYEPDDESFDGKEYHRIEVRLKRPELKIASRKGFVGRQDAAAGFDYRNAKNPVYAAIASPFTDARLDLKMTTLTKELGKKGGTVRLLFHIDGRDLTFTDEPGGLKKAVLNVVVVALDEKAKVAREFNRAYPLKVPERAVSAIRQNGLEYSTDIEFEKPGLYSLRLVVQDDASKELGSAGDFVEIPEKADDRFFVSSFVTTSVDPGSGPVLPRKRPPEAGFAPVFGGGIPAIREYAAGSRIAYLYDIYNPRIDRSTGKTSLTTYMRLFKDGEQVDDLPETSFSFSPEKGTNVFEEIGSYQLKPDLLPGVYVLQITVNDVAAKKSSSAWIDFEIVDRAR
ncbi:MAG: VWA domain-containing protein [Acidobacteria bacterium]|nr:MAG: VWA domain-containing protein [Acidobacteriota bacterium]REJ98103.1 MAG: VWA domain-containing protein [Acidobacteriota bacterium]REK16846.1 MAG: VWA domain-containing protein [Acidobacteriota bacterium]REK42757.1 MAG: VWA domain-containing protein [Acidobacteriota bacterium]